jgi:hypothetical protein
MIRFLVVMADPGVQGRATQPGCGLQITERLTRQGRSVSSGWGTTAIGKQQSIMPARCAGEVAHDDVLAKLPRPPLPTACWSSPQRSGISPNPCVR